MTSHLGYVGEVRRMADEFARVTAAADLTADVAACPDWTVYDLVSHLGVVHRWAAAIVTGGIRVGVEVDDPPRVGDGAADWYSRGADELITALSAADPDLPCWNFTGIHQHKGFWARRQVHELHVHLVDLTQAVGIAMAPVDPVISADGVGEVLDTFMPRLALRDAFPDLRAPLAIVATDVGLAWVLTPRSRANAAAPVHERDPADLRLPVLAGPDRLGGLDRLPPDQIRGASKDILELLWKRSLPDIVEVAGDAQRVARYLGSELTP
jgi:uncharacterized protein (TIGR03083 family)